MCACEYCVNANTCQHIEKQEISQYDCEDFEETFEHHWEMMDDIEREEYSQIRWGDSDDL